MGTTVIQRPVATPAVRQAIELTFRVRTDAFVESRLITSVAQSGALVLASSDCRTDQATVFRLVTQNPVQVELWLAEAGFFCTTNTVLLVELPRPLAGDGGTAALLLAAGMAVRYSYASVGPAGHLFLVFKTEDDARALQILKHSQSLRRAA